MKTPLLRRSLPITGIIAWRYLLGDRSQMLSSTARAALIATTLGVTAMVVTMALMTGYTGDLQRKLIGLQAEVVAQPFAADAFENNQGALTQAAGLTGVAKASRVTYGEGALSSSQVPDGIAITLKGLEPGLDPTFQNTASLARDAKGLYGILIGEELSQRLSAAEGDVLRLVVLGMDDERPNFAYRSVRVAGTFSLGFAEFDSSWVVLDRELLASLPGQVGLEVMEFKLEDPALTAVTAARLEESLGADFMVSSWQRLNHDLFKALALQEWVLFLVLGLIVVVSTFNIASTLVILVRERMRDVGVLGALGMGSRQLWWIFSGYGLFLGAVGIGMGLLIGTSICWTLTRFHIIRFPPEIAAIYFIDSVPFHVEASDLLAITLFSLLVTLLACALPARRAASIQPAAALRYE